MARGYAAGEPTAVGYAIVSSIERDFRWSVPKFLASHPESELTQTALLEAYPLWYEFLLPDGSVCPLRDGDPSVADQAPGIQGRLSSEGWDAAITLPGRSGPVFNRLGSPYQSTEQRPTSEISSALFATLLQVQHYSQWSGVLPSNAEELFKGQRIRPGRSLAISQEETTGMQTPGFLLEVNPRQNCLRITEMLEDGQLIFRWHQYLFQDGQLKVEPELLRAGDPRVTAPGFDVLLRGAVLR